MKNNDNKFFSTHSDGTIRHWNFENKLEEEKVYIFNLDPVTCLNINENDENVISGSKDHSAIVWKLNNEDNIFFSLVGHSDIISSCDFITDNIVATSSWDCSLKLWKLLE